MPEFGDMRYMQTKTGIESESSCKWWYFPVAILILFPYISIIALFAIANGTENNNYYGTVTTTTFSKTVPSVSTGTAFSFSSTGALQTGAGTTVYKNIVDITATSPAYTSVDSFSTSNYLVAYANKGTQTGTIQWVDATSASAATIKATLAVNFYIYELITLADDGSFVAICQDYSTSAETAYLISGKASGSTITLSNSKTKYADEYSVAPDLIQLDSYTFAISYFNTDPNVVYTRYGKVDSTTLEITISNPSEVADNTNYGIYFSLAPLSASTYMVLTYNNYDGGAYGAGLLSASIATVSGTTDATTSTIALSATTNSTSSLEYYFASTKLNDNTVIVAYADANNNFAMVCQAISLVYDSPTSEPTIVFGSTLTVNNGQVFTGTLPTGYMDIDIATLSSSNEFIVLFSDISNSGVLTSMTGKLTSSGELIRTSPDFLLNSGNTNLNTYYTWGALATGKNTYLDSQTAIVSMLSNITCTTCTSNTTFGILERKPLPIGVSGPNDRVAVSGSIENLSGLTPGKYYYANTEGKLIAGNDYAGRTSSGTVSPDGSSLYYVTDSTNDALVMNDGLVGLALQDDQLYLQL